MNTAREIQKLNRIEAEQGITGASSWHHQYKDSAWVYAGGLPLAMTEGDVLCLFSQFGEIERLDMRRDMDTGKFRGFCFIKYEDQRSTILAVDNLIGTTFAGRTLKVDHKFYTPPKKRKRRDEDDVDSSEEEAEDREIEAKKALQDVRWENSEYRSKANLEPPKKKQKLSKEEKKAKKEAKAAKKLRKQEKRERKEREREDISLRAGEVIEKPKREERKVDERRERYRSEHSPERHTSRRSRDYNDYDRESRDRDRNSYRRDDYRSPRK